MSAYVTSVLAVIGINVMLAVSLNMISGFAGSSVWGTRLFMARVPTAPLF